MAYKLEIMLQADETKELRRVIDQALDDMREWMGGTFGTKVLDDWQADWTKYSRPLYDMGGNMVGRLTIHANVEKETGRQLING